MRWFFHRRAFAGNDAKSEKKAVYNVSFTLRMTLTLTIFIFIVMSYPPPPQYANFVRILSSIPNKKLCDGYNSISFKLQWI